jgi:hypothetical protein
VDPLRGLGGVAFNPGREVAGLWCHGANTAKILSFVGKLIISHLPHGVILKSPKVLDRFC